MIELLPSAPPLGLVIDLGRLLRGGRPTPSAQFQPDDPALRAALIDYEEHLLGRLTGAARLTEARDAMLRHPSHAAECVAIFVEALLDRLGISWPSRSVAALRRVLRIPVEQIRDAGLQGLAQQPSLSTCLAQQYRQIAAAARRTTSLIGAAEVAVMENIHVLRGAGQRFALGQMIAVAGELSAGLPKRVPRRMSQAGVSDSALQTQSTYPIGGYGALTTTGGLESLVSSELMYMDRVPTGVDLFALRWASAELLKYTRDESVFIRQRRIIVLLLSPDLRAARLKTRGWPCQRLMAICAWVVAAVTAWIGWFDATDLQIRIEAVQSDSEGSGLEDELQLLRLALRAPIAAGTVVFGTASLAHISESIDTLATTAQVDVIQISNGDQAPCPGGKGSSSVCWALNALPENWEPFKIRTRALMVQLA